MIKTISNFLTFLGIAGEDEDAANFEDLSVHNRRLEKAREGRVVLPLQRVDLSKRILEMINSGMIY